VNMQTHSARERGTIYTLGYSQPKAAATLERLMRQPRMLLIDVRYQPVSRWNAQWNRAELTARYGEQYRWERRLGNRNYWSRDRPIQLPVGSRDAVRAAATLVCAGTSLVLLCCCGDERACHRSLVAKLIQDALPVPTVAREVWA
jgi:uncharacterized protein (DUF488 family)